MNIRHSASLVRVVAPKTPHLGRRIKEAREALKLFQADVAEALNVESNHVSRIERGLVDPPRKARVVLQRLLKRPAEYFVDEPLPQWATEDVVELDQADVYPARAALRRSTEWAKASEQARAYVASIGGLSGDYSLAEWKEELRVADRMVQRGQRLDVTIGAEEDVVEPESTKDS